MPPPVPRGTVTRYAGHVVRRGAGRTGPRARGAVAAALLLGGALLVRGQDADPAAAFRERVAPLFRARCVACHGPEKAESGLRLDRVDASADLETLGRIREKLAEGAMPPESEPRPPADEVARALSWIEVRTGA